MTFLESTATSALISTMRGSPGTVTTSPKCVNTRGVLSVMTEFPDAVVKIETMVASSTSDGTTLEDDMTIRSPTCKVAYNGK